MKQALIRSAILALLLFIFGANSANSQKLNYRCTWIANSFGDKSGQWVQNWIEGIYVTPDGTVYSNAGWDEGGREVGIYKDGRVIGSAGHTHGWGYSGGSVVTANAKYLYIAQSVNSEGGNLKDSGTWPEAGKVWYGISRRLLSDPQKPAPFAGGRGGKGDTLAGQFLLLSEYAEGVQAPLGGLAASGTRLYVSDPVSGHIRVFDAETMKPAADWRLDGCSAVALGPDESIWCVQALQGKSQILHVSTRGTELPGSVKLPKTIIPHGLAVDADSRLLIADDGPDQNVKIFVPGGKSPVAELGVRGGVLSGPVRGAVGSARFHDISSVGVDAHGNIYVAGGYGNFGDGVGTELECYSPTGKRLWQLLGLFFVDEAGADPLQDTEVFGKHEHISMNYERTVPGSEWSYRAFTLDRFRFPDDPRLHASPNTVWVRRIGGKRYLYMTDMYSSFLAIYRFEGTGSEIAIPCGYFAKATQKDSLGGSWPAGAPANGEWIWIDSTGDGKFRQREYDVPKGGGDAPPLWGWWVDEHGDVWQATESVGIRKFKLQAINSIGAPVYSYTAMSTTAPLQEFTSLQRAQYSASDDTMYLSGYTPAQPNDHGYWKVIGREVACVEKWSSGNRSIKWKAPVSTPDTGHVGQVLTPASFTVAGDYLLTVSVLDARIEVYNRHTGAHIGYMTPTAEVGGKSGWVDIPYGISAHRRSNGEYIIIVEDDEYARDIIYRWKP